MSHVSCIWLQLCAVGEPLREWIVHRLSVGDVAAALIGNYKTTEGISSLYASHFFYHTYTFYSVITHVEIPMKGMSQWLTLVEHSSLKFSFEQMGGRCRKVRMMGFMAAHLCDEGRWRFICHPNLFLYNSGNKSLSDSLNKYQRRHQNPSNPCKVQYGFGIKAMLIDIHHLSLLWF